MLREIALRLASKRAGTARAVGALDVGLAAWPRRGEKDQLQLSLPAGDGLVGPSTVPGLVQANRAICRGYFECPA